MSPTLSPRRRCRPHCATDATNTLDSLAPRRRCSRTAPPMPPTHSPLAPRRRCSRTAPPMSPTLSPRRRCRLHHIADAARTAPPMPPAPRHRCHQHSHHSHRAADAARTAPPMPPTLSPRPPHLLIFVLAICTRSRRADPDIASILLGDLAHLPIFVRFSSWRAPVTGAMTVSGSAQALDVSQVVRDLSLSHLNQKSDSDDSYVITTCPCGTPRSTEGPAATRHLS